MHLTNSNAPKSESDDRNSVILKISRRMWARMDVAKHLGRLCVPSKFHLDELLSPEIALLQVRRALMSGAVSGITF